MKKLVALTLALLMTLQAVVLVSAEEAYVDDAEVAAEAVPEAPAEAAEPVESSEDTGTNGMVVVEEEGVVPSATEQEETIASVEEKVLYGAYPLPIDGKDVVGKVSAMVPTQAYVVTVPQTGVLTLVFNPTYQMKISILDEAMTTAYVSEQVVAPGTATFNKHLNPGVYTVVVFRDNAETETAYTLKATHQAVGTTIAGSSIVNPYELVFGADYASGAITESSSENWILVRTAAAGKVSFETRTYEAGFSVELSKTSTPFSFLPATALKPGTPNTPGSDLFSYYLEPGAYFIRVSNSGGNKGIYDIRASFTAVASNDVEPNNGIGVAQPINIGANMRGILSLTDDTDVYSVMVKKPTDVIVQVSDYTEGLLVTMNSWQNTANMVPALSKAPSAGNETKPEVRQERVRLEPDVMYYITISRNAGIRSGYYDLVLQNTMTVETVTVAPAGGPLGITLTLSATTSLPSALYAFEPVWYNTVTSAWENPESPGFKLFSTTPSVTYKPSKKGTYIIRCWVYDGFRWTVGDSKGFAIMDSTVVTSVTFPTNSVPKGLPVPVTIETDNATPVLYGARLISRATNAFVGDPVFSTSKTVNITPPAPGDYVILGMAYDGVNWSFKYSFDLNVFSALKLLTLTANRATALTTEPIQYKLTTNGEPMVMACYIYSIGSTEVFRKFKTGNDMYTDTYTCPFLGELDVKVHAFDGDRWHEITGPKVLVTSDVVTVSGLDKNFTGGYVGQQLTFTIRGTGLPATTHYSLFNSSGTIVASSTARSRTFTTVINTPGVYLCRLIYTHNGVTQAVDTGWFNVSNESIVYNLLVSPNSVRANTQVGYNALIQGVIPRAMEVYTYYVDGGGVYRQAGKQTVTGITSTVFTPTEVGTYSVVVFLDTGAGIDYSKPFSFYNVYTVIP